MYLAAVLSTIAAWFVGLLFDANLDVGDPIGFLSLRILFPILVMGVFLLSAIHKNDKK